MRRTGRAAWSSGHPWSVQAGGKQPLHRDHAGRVLTREEFERLLPFLYPENMAVWGLLPLELGGKSFDKDALYRERQTFELKPDMLPGLGPDAGVHPLQESRPERAGLAFPEDRFRLGPRLEFVNADANAVDEGLTTRFTQALARAGCVFPLRAAFGQDSLFKPFDEGWFLLDAAGGLFHVKRERDQPRVVRIPLDPGLRVRAVHQRENEQRGLLLAEDGRVFLLLAAGLTALRLGAPAGRRLRPGWGDVVWTLLAGPYGLLARLGLGR